MSFCVLRFLLVILLVLSMNVIWIDAFFCPMTKIHGSAKNAKIRNISTIGKISKMINKCESILGSVGNRDTCCCKEQVGRDANEMMRNEWESKVSSSSTAILLNMNARSVTPELASIAASVVGWENVFVCQTAQDAKAAARIVARGILSGVLGECRVDSHQETHQDSHQDNHQNNPEIGHEDNPENHEMNGSKNGSKGIRKYSLVVPIGGDGTLSSWVNDMVEQILHQNQQQREAISIEQAVRLLPAVGYIPMGTGNGLGYVIGCRLPSITKTKPMNHHGHKHIPSNKDRNNSTNYINNTANSRKGTIGTVDRIKHNKWRNKLHSAKVKLSACTGRLFQGTKQRRYRHAREVMIRLKQVGDELQQQQQQQQKQQSKEETTLPNIITNDHEEVLCTIVDMPMMEVTYPSNDGTRITSNNAASNNRQSYQQQQQQSLPSPPILKGDLCFFAGSGFDSLLLYHYQQLKSWSATSLPSYSPPFVKRTFNSVFGYVLAFLFRTLPETIRFGNHKIHVVVTTQIANVNETDDNDVYWIDHRRGDFAELAILNEHTCQDTISSYNNNNNTHATNRTHLIYSGTTGIIAASTTPYYGGGLRLFPFARLYPPKRHAKLHLRLGRISPLRGFWNVKSIFSGSYRDVRESAFGCLDFIGGNFDVQVTSRGGGDRRGGADVPKGFPFQHSGESVGYKQRFHLRVVKEPIKFVSFLKPRVVIEED